MRRWTSWRRVDAESVTGGAPCGCPLQRVCDQAPRPRRRVVAAVRSAPPRMTRPRSSGARMAIPKSVGCGFGTSKERVRLPRHSGRHAHGPKAHDGTITTEAPDVMWGTDMTATVTVAEARGR